jgi:hypothetical protein
LKKKSKKISEDETERNELKKRKNQANLGEPSKPKLIF